MEDPESQPFFDRLFAAPLAEFVAVRKALAKELRDRGLAEAAAAMAASAKPTASAWALNQVARDHADTVARFLAAAQQARSVMRDARRSREAQGALVAAAAEVARLATSALEGGGIGASPTHVGRIERSLRAAPLASDGDRERLARGRLTHDIDLSGDLGAFGETDDAAPAAPPEAEAADATDASSRVAKDDAKKAVTDLGAAREARKQAEAREKAERAARERVERERAAEAAEAHATRLEALAARATRELDTLRRAAESAIRAASEAKARAEAASRDAGQARAEATAARARAAKGD
jgi:hypothetical protein